jgi:hypothetical protein
MPNISRAALTNFQPHDDHAHGELWVTLLEKGGLGWGYCRIRCGN